MQLTLTSGLLLAALAVLLVLAAHGWWRSRRASSRRAAPRREPALEEQAAAALEPAASLPAEARPVRRTARIDPLIDAVISLQLDAPMLAEALLAHQPSTRRAGTKPMLLEGRDALRGDWGPLMPGQRYDELQLAVQMANRTGALNEIEFSEFVQKAQAFADAIGATPDVPDMLDVVARARELDNLSSPLDAQLSVCLRANSVAWSAAYLQQAAGRHGFVPGAMPGRLVVPGAEEHSPPVLVLAFEPQAALADDTQRVPVRECALLLDVPQTAESAEPFPAWHRAATALADDLDASLVDDRGQAITLHAFAAIGQDLQQLYRRLEALDMPAGSAVARRLFS